MVHSQVLFSPKNAEEAVGILGGRIRTNNFNFDFSGSPYMNDEFSSGEIYYNNQWHFTDIPVRYNIFNDEIEYKKEDKNTIYALKPDTLFNMIIISADTLIVDFYEKNKEIKSGFFKLLNDGEVSLLVKMEVEFIEAQAETTHEMAMPAKFHKKMDQYYVRKQGQVPQMVKNLKKLIESLENHHEELNAYIKQEKLSGRKEKDLKQLIHYYNTL